jgi:hypothetical protein
MLLDKIEVREPRVDHSALAAGIRFAPGAVAGAQAAPAQAGAVGGQLPFEYGSNQYREAPFVTVAQQLDANPHDIVANITPGGFLRGITLQVTSAGGVIGAGVLQADAPYSIFSSITLEDISGGPILYPMQGYAYALVQKYARPWSGDPAKRPDFSNTINPAFTLRLFAEVKDTLGVLANTDARAQYRLRVTISPGQSAGPNGLTSTAPTTQPVVTVNVYLETWAQPDLQDLLQNPIQQIPDGLVASRFNMHEIPPVTAGANVIRETLTGNEIRCLIFVFRNGGALAPRTNLTDANTGAIDFRLDNRRLWKMKPSQIVEEMNDFYDFLGAAAWVREAGVYVVPRFRLGQEGDYWLQTVEQTLLQLEFNGADLGIAGATVEIIYDVLAIAGNVPDRMEGI